MTRRKGKYLWYILPVLLLFACNSGTTISEKDFPGECWSYQDTLAFEWEVADPGTPAGLAVSMRFNQDYTYNNLFLWLETTDPDGNKSSEKLEYQLMDASGKWFQDNSESPEIELTIRPVNLMPAEGTWKFRLVQFMQEDDLCGVLQVRIREKN